MRSNTQRDPQLQQSGRIELAGVTKRFATPGGGPANTFLSDDPDSSDAKGRRQKEKHSFTALRDVTMTVEPGEFCAVVGPSGCGKSTTLTLVAGLDRASEGTVSVGGQPVTGIGRGTS